MAATISPALLASLLLLLATPLSSMSQLQEGQSVTLPKSDIDLLEFPLNLEYLEAEFFLFGSMGHGLDQVAPNLPMGGPPPLGAKKANLDPLIHDDPLIRDITARFAYQEVGHLRAIKGTVKGFPRPLFDLVVMAHGAKEEELSFQVLQVQRELKQINVGLGERDRLFHLELRHRRKRGGEEEEEGGKESGRHGPWFG